MDDTSEVWSVSQVNRAVKKLIETDLENLWILGEIANWTRASSGHCYFTLKDRDSQIRCVMFKSDVSKLPIDPNAGMVVRVFGSLGLYEPRGEYQVVVRSLMDEGGEGLWRLAAEKVRRKLEGEGLLDKNLKRPLPTSIRTLGVVTSLGGAALYDILTVIERRSPWTEVIVRDTRVQGETAAQEISEAIQVLSESGMVDLVIVARGGGSMEDLWAFNEEPVARSIAASPVPVVSAIGHEIDITLADLVADFRAPTPSAGAEMAVKDGEMLKGMLGVKSESMFVAIANMTSEYRRKLIRERDELMTFQDVVVNPQKEYLDRTGDELESTMRAVVSTARKELSNIGSMMQVLSPLATLSRGYALPKDLQGRILRTAGSIPPGMQFSLRVSDGTIFCESLGEDN
ncbi:MAG: exodeoxyribonuclease VII large subunit [Longimicrobiales bacterium]|nr:exodeoxyribonuclease VII large subunit [Longimicrobiales bacterium]